MEKFPADNTTEDIINKTTSLGGTGTNIAVVAAKLGCPTALCAFVGNDFSGCYEKQIIDSGLITDEFIHTDRYDTSGAVIINNRDMVQKVVFYQGPQGMADELDMLLTSNARKSEYTHFCTGQPSYYIKVMNEIAGDTTISLDPAQETHRIWNADTFRNALEKADSLFCNQYEAESLCRYADVESIFDIDLDLIVCTYGSEGSKAKVKGEMINIPVVKTEAVVDPTGCGDAYRSGFYASLYRGYSIPEALAIASTVSSFIIERTGALTNIPTWEEVMERAEPYLKSIN